MPKSIKAVVLSVSLALVLFTVAGGLVVGASTDDKSAYRQLGVFSEVLSRIRSEYVEEPNIPAVTDGALHGLLEALDANSSYLSPDEYKKFKAMKQDAKGDVGAAISKRYGYAAIISVIPGGPAAKAGIQAGDIIESIEGISSRELALAQVRGMLIGEPGSNVNLTMVRPRKPDPEKVTVTRDVVKIPAVVDRALEAGIGYIQIQALTKGKSQEVAKAIKQLTNGGAKKLVLDLRYCGSGEVSEGVAVANLFLDRGLIAYLQGQRYPREAYNAEPNRRVTDLPLVVLVNRGTAGPAEIVAGAILENARGDVLGDKTFGVGSLQKVLEMGDGSAIILSIAKWYTPSGKAIQDSAITPNILVADAGADDFSGEDQDETPLPTPEKSREDEQLRRAIEVLKNREVRAAMDAQDKSRAAAAAAQTK